MNLDTVTVVVGIGGIVLLYAAVKNKDPRDVVRAAMGKDEIYPQPGKKEVGVWKPLPPTAPGGGGGVPRFTGGYQLPIWPSV